MRLTIAALSLACLLIGCGSESYNSDYSTPDPVDDRALLDVVWDTQTYEDQIAICAGVLDYGLDWAATKVMEGDSEGYLTYEMTTEFLADKCL